MPGDSSSGPLVTDRHPAENPDASKPTGNGTPYPRQSTSSRAVVVTGVIEVDLARHVDRGGGIWEDGRLAVHRALSSCPPGVRVRVRIGRALFLYDLVLDVLAEMTTTAPSVEIVGTYPDGVGAAVLGLRERLEAGR